MKTTNMSPTLYLLEGKDLVSICFVLDYIEFVFGDLVLASLADPVIFEGGQGYSFEHAGFRDALCRRIKKLVSETAESEKLLSITFEDGVKLVIPLDSPTHPGPEMATLSGRGTFYAAWTRPD
jgi:hypothetical protein